MRPLITKREALAGGAIAIGATLCCAGNFDALAPGRRSDAIFFYHRGAARSVSFAENARAAGMRVIDIAEEETRVWRNVRAGFEPHVLLYGATRWSDWIVLRDAFSRQGRGSRCETLIGAGGKDALILWDMSVASRAVAFV